MSDGRAEIFSKDHKTREYRLIPKMLPRFDMNRRPIPSLPDETTVIADLVKQPPHQFADGRVLVVFRPGVSMQSDVMRLDRSSLTNLRRSVVHNKLSSATLPQYTNDAMTNRLLATLTAQGSERLFRHVSRSVLSSMRARAASRTGARFLEFENAYRLYIAGTPVRKAVQQLSKLPSVEYASPDWIVGPLNTGQTIRLPQNAVRTRVSPLRQVVRTGRSPYSVTGRPGARTTSTIHNATSSLPAYVPPNYDLTTSGQSMLNAPSDDAAAAFDEIHRHFAQLPGKGEIITNVSLGDLDDVSATTNSSDPCNFYASSFGPTTEIISGQRYIDWPGMPLIPAYTADDSGNLSGTGEVCGVDPFLGEVGLDFSMMAALPDEDQRPGASAQGFGLGDILGMAPGAQYRLVVPGNSATAISDLAGAFMGAAMQTPQPNVITASIGFGFDGLGFPGRFLEDDPIMQATIASIVNASNIVVCISAGDGTRVFTNVAIGPSGGSAATNVANSSSGATDLNDVGLSTEPSRDVDTGSIDVGGTTLDDVFAGQPQYENGVVQAQHAYAETRWDGFTLLSSGFGSRVNVSAPSDNVISILHLGNTATSVGYSLEGGTSASAPETAAAAAVALQVARLTGHPLSSPIDVRNLLTQTASPVLPLPQADQMLNVGPQIDVRRTVETLLANAGIHETISVPRVAVEQRRIFAIGQLRQPGDFMFTTDTDPTNIDLIGPGDVPNYLGWNAYAWITIAPDWEFTTPQTKYNLMVSSTKKILATTPWARLQPQTILAAAGLPFASNSARTVNLTYSATDVNGNVVQTSFDLTLGHTTGLTIEPLAPRVPAVVTGRSIPVTYDLTNMQDVQQPMLVVSQPARFSPYTDGGYFSGVGFKPVYTLPLSALKGTVNVPVSALQGGGIYGISIYNFGTEYAIGPGVPGIWLPCAVCTDFAYTRVQPSFGRLSAVTRPPAPLLSSGGSAPGHSLEIPYGSSFQVSYNVSNVAGANGAILEISAPGPTNLFNYNAFNNPNGTIVDKNGSDTGSVFVQRLVGSAGTVVIDPVKSGVLASLVHTVRVIPVEGNVPVGEASGVSSLSMDGVVPSDGGITSWGYQINANGGDGFLTSWGQSPDTGLWTLSSLQTFDQTTNQIRQVIDSGSNTLYLAPGTQNTFANDIGLFGAQDMSSLFLNNPFYIVESELFFGNPSWHTLKPATGTVGSWSPATSTSVHLWSTALNRSNDQGAFLAFDYSQPWSDHWRVFASNPATDSVGPLIDVSTPLNSAPGGAANASEFAIGENALTHSAVLAGGNSECTNFVGLPSIITTVALDTGKIGSFVGTNDGAPYAITVDSTTNRAAALDSCTGGLSIYDLTSQTPITDIPFNRNDHGIGGFGVAVDENAHLFAAVTADVTDTKYNANGMGAILVYDENGNLMETLEHVNLFNIALLENNSILQLNPSRRTGYIIGPFEAQLQPFKY